MPMTTTHMSDVYVVNIPAAAMAILPPWPPRATFTMALMAHAAKLMSEGDAPMATMDTTVFHSRRYMPRVKRTVLRGCRKCHMTNTADTAIAISVATAAPVMPMSSQKMNTGSSATLHTAPIIIVSMALRG